MNRTATALAILAAGGLIAAAAVAQTAQQPPPPPPFAQPGPGMGGMSGMGGMPGPGGHSMNMGMARQMDPQRMEEMRIRREAFRDARRAMLAEGRIAALRGGLKLTPEQDKLWPAVETALRGLMAMRRSGPPPQGEDMVARLRAGAERARARADAMSRLADAVQPLIASFSDEQKIRARALMRGGGMGGGMGGPMGGHGDHDMGDHDMGAHHMGGHHMGGPMGGPMGGDRDRGGPPPGEGGPRPGWRMQGEGPGGWGGPGGWRREGGPPRGWREGRRSDRWADRRLDETEWNDGDN